MICCSFWPYAICTKLLRILIMKQDNLQWNVMRSQIPATKIKCLCVSGGLMCSLSLTKSSMDSIMFLTSHQLKMLAYCSWRIQSLKNFNLSMCQGQCYDEATNMKKVAAEIKSIESQALLLYPTGSVEFTRHLEPGRVHNTSSTLTKEIEAFRVHATWISLIILV